MSGLDETWGANLFGRYLTALTESGNWAAYINDSLWTAEATRALVLVGQSSFRSGVPTARNHKDHYARSEYLTLDVCITDPGTWGPPLFIAEHENSPWAAKVAYCAWKLLATEAKLRVLVAYYTPKSDLKSAAAIESAVLDVCKDNPGKDILVISGDYNARPTSEDELRKAYTARVVGVHGSGA